MLRGGRREGEVIAYNDSCVGQNKNVTVMVLWLYMIESGWSDKIKHKFLVPAAHLLFLMKLNLRYVI